MFKVWPLFRPCSCSKAEFRGCFAMLAAISENFQQSPPFNGVRPPMHSSSAYSATDRRAFS
eukprot:3740044-Lingulodinium_polyedra.AAC.1